jgi:PAS domain S-box-containing protein
MARLMRAHDWSLSPLGPPGTWSQALRTCVRLMLNTRHPLFLFWGPDAICLYNDGYKAILGRERHAIALGNKGAIVWDEIWDVLYPQIEQVLAGGEATWHENHLIPLTRDGALQDAYWTYSYSPVDDDHAANGVGGVLVIVTETTETVLAERQAKLEGRRFARLFEQAPTFMAVLRGPDHVFEYCNPGYVQLVGHRDIVGKAVAEVIPEAAGQGYFELLDGVYRSGTTFTARDMKIRLQRAPDGPLEERYLDFVYQPIIEDDGAASGIFVEGVDVTERVMAELHDRAVSRLTDETRDIDDPAELAFVASKILGETLGVSRVGLGLVDVASQSYVAQPAWNAPGLIPPPDTMSLRPFGAYIEKLSRGEVVRVTDAETDDLTRGYSDILAGRHAIAFVNVPVIEREGLVAILYVSNATPREWSDNDIALIRDVAERTRNYSERLRSAADLRKSEEQLRLATEASDIGFWDIDMMARTLFLTPNVKAMFGLAPQAETSLQTYNAAVHPDDRDRNVAAFRAAADPDVRASYDVEYRTIGHEDGAERWVAIKGRGIFNDDGDCVRVIGTAIDITARKQVERELRELNEDLERRVAEQTRLRTRTWEVSPEIIGIFNEEGVFETSNPAWQVSLGWSDEDIRATRFFDFVHPDDLAETYAAWATAASGQLALRFENRCRAKSGAWHWFAWIAVAEGGKVYCSARDITAEKAATETLARTEEALRQSQKMEAVGQLTGGIAHDFNNMLAVVMGSLELLNRRIGTEDARALHYVQAATDGARRAANLTQRLLAFSRQQPLQPEVIDPNRLVSGMSDLLRHSIGVQVMLETVLAGGIWRIEVDPNQLENVILNLGVNARDAMPGGGKLTIETQNAHLDARYVSSEMGVPAGHYVMIAVTDTGAGMSADVIAKAFDPFFTTKEVGKGTGLGLSQVYGFVKQSGGHVKIYSEVGHGTTIKIYLPRAHAAEATDPEIDETFSTFMGDAREVILVVDDEPAVRQFSADALGELGYRVLEAGSAAAALQLLAAHPEISLLFTDIIMPETNGRRLADEAHKIRPDLKVLYTTGYTRNAVVHNGVVDKGVQLIGKPFTIDELAARVREVLDF